MKREGRRKNIRVEKGSGSGNESKKRSGMELEIEMEMRVGTEIKDTGYKNQNGK